MADNNFCTLTKYSIPNWIDLENFARTKLTEILPVSINEKVEYGAVIYKHNQSKKLGATKLCKSTESDNKVDVGLSKPNCGCPADTKPIAFYHTHPFLKVGELHMEQDFSTPEDKRLANDNRLIGFLGSADGGFRCYLPAKLPTTTVNGVETIKLSFDDGTLIPEALTFCETILLNGKLPTVRAFKKF